MSDKKPGPYHSKLRPHIDLIRQWRRAGKTWRDVVEKLAKLDPPVKADAGSICAFVKRYKKKPHPIGAEPEELPPPAGATLPADPPKRKAGKLTAAYLENMKTQTQEKPKVRFNEKNVIR